MIYPIVIYIWILPYNVAHEVVEAASRQSAKSSAMRVSSATEEDDDEEDDGDTEVEGEPRQKQ